MNIMAQTNRMIKSHSTKPEHWAVRMTRACQGVETIDIVINRPWNKQKTMKLLPGGTVRGTPIESYGKKTLVRFKAAEVAREIEVFVKLAKYVEKEWLA